MADATLVSPKVIMPMRKHPVLDYKLLMGPKLFFNVFIGGFLLFLRYDDQLGYVKKLVEFKRVEQFCHKKI